MTRHRRQRIPRLCFTKNQGIGWHVYYGEPRLTNDIDVVVQLPPARIGDFWHEFPSPELYLDEQSVRDAAASHGQCNLIHPASGLEVDFMIPADSPFERSRFDRAVRARPGPDSEATFAAPEEVIIKKLEYYAAGGSEKHLRDIAGVLKISLERVNRGYVARWAAQLGVAEVWKALLARLSDGD
jgi:hypothetical protein